jgi:cytochrome c-type biogenesis protein CcmH
LLRRWAPWILLVLVGAGALGYGLNRSSHQSLDARVTHIAGEVRCPVCSGESAAQSDAAPSVAIRNQIRQDLQAGQTEAQILARLVRAYGPGILEKPQPSGIGLLVWVLPVVAIAGMTAVVIVTVSRWRARAGAPADMADRPDANGARAAPEGPLAAPEQAELSEASTPALLAAAPAAPDPLLASTPALPTTSLAPAPPRPSRRTRRLVIAAGAALLTGGACWAVVEGSSTRLAGQTITGAALGPQAEAATLQRAQQEEAEGQDVNAVKDYEKVLTADPNQAVALTGAGWLLAQTQQPSVLQEGLAMLARAETSDPSYAPAHVYRGIALLSEGDYADSVPELQWYLAHNPDPELAPKVRTALQEAQSALQPQAPATTTRP